MIFTKLATTALAALTAFTVGAVPAMANTGSFRDHVVLWNTIQEVGIKTFINEPSVCDRNIDGAYYSELGAMVICQDNGRPGGPEVDWTDNDLDTLRHETHHLVQDCLDGVGDGSLVPLFGDQDGVLDFVTRTQLTTAQINNIIDNYAELGLDRDAILLELEAFATASDVNAITMANVVARRCSAR